MTGNFQDAQAFGEFPKYPDIWGISQIPRFLRNFPNIQSFLELYHPQIPTGIWGISQMPGYLGNFPIALYVGSFGNVNLKKCKFKLSSKS